MSLMDLESVLEKKGYEALYVEIFNKEIKQNRVYLELEDKKNRKFQVYFAEFNEKPFLYVSVNHPIGYNYPIEPTDEEQQRCREVKFKVLKLLKSDGIAGIEQYKTLESVPLIPPKQGRKRVEL